MFYEGMLSCLQFLLLTWHRVRPIYIYIPLGTSWLKHAPAPQCDMCAVSVKGKPPDPGDCLQAGIDINVCDRIILALEQ